MKRLYLIFGLVIFALPIHADFASDLEKAKKGDPEAQNRVGDMYFQDENVPLAVYWYRKAAEQGHSEGQYNLGFAYEVGQGVEQDYSLAMYWYKKAMDAGDVAAKFSYEELLKEGHVAAYTSSGKVVNVQPALLSLVENSVYFEDPNNNNTLDANERSRICFRVTNKGKSAAVGCQVKISATGNTSGIAYSNLELSSLAVGTTQTIEIPVTTDHNTKDGQVTFTIEVTEPNGFGTEPITLTINTRAFNAPMLKIVDYAVSGNGTLQKKVPFELQLLLQNVKHGTAEDVDVTIDLPNGVMLWDGNISQHFASLAGGEKKQFSIELAISGNYASNSVSIPIRIKEKHGMFAENRTIQLQLEQQLRKSNTFTLQGENQVETYGDIQIGSIERKNTAEINVVKIIKGFELIDHSSVLSLYSNEFGKLEMPDRDESFPYALFRVSIQGDKNQVRMAKQHLMLDMGQLFQTEKTVTSYNNIVLFLVPNNARNIYITCGDGCEKQLIYSGRLESNKIYDGLIEIK